MIFTFPGCEPIEINFHAQCGCGHIIFEKYMIANRTSNTEEPKTAIAFSWCGFCRTRHEYGEHPIIRKGPRALPPRAAVTP